MPGLKLRLANYPKPTPNICPLLSQCTPGCARVRLMPGLCQKNTSAVLSCPVPGPLAGPVKTTASRISGPFSSTFSSCQVRLVLSGFQHLRFSSCASTSAMLAERSSHPVARSQLQASGFSRLFQLPIPRLPNPDCRIRVAES